MKTRIWNVIVLVAFSMLAGFASQANAQDRIVESAPAKTIDVEYGAKRPILDTAGWIFGVPRKLMMWDSRVDNHDVTADTVDEVASYIATRDLDGVKVRVNQWDPIGEWRRLVGNKRIAPGWRYTLGTLHQIRYVFVPGRLFGRDTYNPYTNTVSLYSDVPAMGLVESAYATDVQTRKRPGTYAAVQSLPLASLWHETIATDEVIRYVSLYGTPDEIAETRKILYARYGAEVGGEISSVVPAQHLDWLGAGAGHLSAMRRNRALKQR